MARGVLSENGKAALTACLDPFHDQQIQHLRGWPDTETQPSIVRTVRQSTTVKALADGDNIMIYTWPILNEAVTRKSIRRNAVIDDVIDDVATTRDLGPVTVTHYPSTTNMTFTSGTYAHHFYLDSSYLLDSCRLIGMGVEVYDVTAEIYKQGTITCFQVPQSTNEPEAFIVKSISEVMKRPSGPSVSKGTTPTIDPKTVYAPAVTILPTPVNAIPLKKYPSSLDAIMQVEGTRQWDARQGAYTVIPFHSRDNFPGQPVYTTPAVYDDSLLIAHEEVDFLNQAPLNIGPWALPQQEGDFVVFLANKFAPVHSKGILLSGLNANSTFTINVIFYLESFPAVDNLPLVSLARPSAHLDEVALEMMSVCTMQLPIAVPVDMNGLGDWFAEAVSEIAPYVSAIGKGFGLGPLSAIADSAGEYANNYMKSDKYENTGGFFAPKKSLQKAPPRSAAPNKVVQQGKKKRAIPKQAPKSKPQITKKAEKDLDRALKKLAK